VRSRRPDSNRDPYRSHSRRRFVQADQLFVTKEPEEFLCLAIESERNRGRIMGSGIADDGDIAGAIVGCVPEEQGHHVLNPWLADRSEVGRDNLGVEDVVTDMSAFIGSLREVNPKAKVILTVSPVPLFATAVDRHVLVSTTYSKSVLRVAAQALVESYDYVFYFPAYEIVAGNFSRGEYFAADLRSIREPGVEHVMSLFFRHATDDGAGDVTVISDAASHDAAAIALAFDRETEELVGLLCVEELIGLDESSSAM
jgi:hypothetical protein